MIKRALLSVSDKSGIVDFARRLSAAGVEIVSTGGTRAELARAGVAVTNISEVTGFPEIMDGRVKTLHPAVHAALLAKRDAVSHMQALSELGYRPIDMVVVNLYPFRNTVQKPGVLLEEALENIDIGGPTMLRSAAKNYRDVVVVANPARYDEILDYIENKTDLPQSLRLSLAVEAFRHTAAYDSLITGFLGGLAADTPVFADVFTTGYERRYDLRYGENPHQKATLYSDPLYNGPSIVGAEQLGGKELSYNNIADADAALRLVLEFSAVCVVAVKHANPCGVGVASRLSEAFQKAHDGDPVSIFGGIIACNRSVDLATARLMSKILLDVIIAPDFDKDALDVLKKKKNTRILRYAEGERIEAVDLKKVMGGLLVQEADAHITDRAQWKTVSNRHPTTKETHDLEFAWTVAKYVKSNAIVLAKDGMAVGIGPGQPNRIDSARIAISRAGDKAPGSVLASDAFFPFPDVAHAAAEAGIVAMAHPGGSIRDKESIQVANEHDMAFVFTGTRHFRH